MIIGRMFGIAWLQKGTDWKLKHVVNLGFIILPSSFCQLVPPRQIYVDAPHADKIILAE